MIGSFHTIVQLCAARNHRHRSAMRYKGVAEVTCRRPRKRFCLWYNPDKHWSSALYRGLNHLQLTDGQGKVIINRDDAAGFRLGGNPLIAMNPLCWWKTGLDYFHRLHKLLSIHSSGYLLQFYCHRNNRRAVCWYCEGIRCFPKKPVTTCSRLGVN